MLKEKVARAIKQLKKGKTEYFDEIYDLTRASVYYVIRGILKDSYLVEDAMQETYVAFLNSIAKIDDEQNPLSYLLQIAKNKALDEARRKTRAAGANIDDVEIATSDVTVSDLPLLEHARQNLSDDEFRILELTTIYGYRRVEVAKMLGEPISTINWKYNKIIKKVKTFYGEEETEVSTTLSGVMVFGDQKFDVTGKKEIETEGNEKETSIEFTTYSNTNPRNFVKIKQSVEVENGAQEVEYEYEIYENGEKAREFKLEIEDENGKTEVSFKMEIENVPEETEYKIIKGDVDGKFKIKYEKGKEKGFITVESVEGGYKLTYNNGYSEVI